MKKSVLLLLALCYMVQAKIQLQPDYFIYIAGNNMDSPEQVYVSSKAVEKGIITLKGTETLRLLFNKAHSYLFYDDYGRRKIVNFYDKSFFLGSNPFPTNIDLKSSQKLTNYHDIDSFRWPTVDSQGNIMFFQKYNRDVNILCFIADPLKNNNFNFVNPSDKNIRADAWGEIQKVSERDLDYWFDGKKYQIIYIKNNDLYFAPYPGAESIYHKKLIDISDEINSPVWDRTGDKIFYLAKNILYMVTLDKNRNVIQNKKIKKLNKSNVFKIIPNPLYQDIFLYRYENDRKVGIGLLIYKDGKVEEIQISKSTQYDDINPTWAPDGERVAFIRRIPETNNFEFRLYTFDIVSNQLKLLTPPKLTLSNNSYPKWLPDGSGILFIGRENNPIAQDNIFLIAANGANKYYKFNYSLNGKPLNRIVDIEIYPKDFSKISYTNNNIPIYLFISASKSTKNEIYRVKLGKKHCAIQEKNNLIRVLKLFEKKGLEPTLVNSYLTDVDQAMRVEKLRKQFYKNLQKRKRFYSQILGRQIAGNKNIKINYRWKYRYYKDQYQKVILEYENAFSTLQAQLSNIFSNYHQKFEKIFSNETMNLWLMRIKRGEVDNLNELFSNLDLELKKFDKNVSLVMMEQNKLNDEIANKINRFLEEDKSYGYITAEIKRLKEQKDRLCKQYSEKIKNVNTLAPEEQQLKGKYLKYIIKIEKLGNDREYSPAKLDYQELLSQKKRIQELTRDEKYQRLLARFYQELEQIRISRTRGNTTFFTLGISSGLGLGKSNRLLLSPYFKYQFNNKIGLHTFINFGDVFFEKDAFSFHGTIQDSISNHRDTLDYVAGVKHWEFGLGINYNINFGKFEICPEIGVQIQQNSLRFQIQPDSLFYYYKSDEQKHLSSLSQMLLYPYLQLNSSYQVIDHLSVGFLIKYAFPVSISIFGDDMDKIQTSLSEKNGIITPDNNKITSNKFNTIYLGVSIGFEF